MSVQGAGSNELFVGLQLFGTVPASGGRSKTQMIDVAHAWDELSELLGPIHDDVLLFARRIDITDTTITLTVNAPPVD
jgi:hypothetical protein